MPPLAHFLKRQSMARPKDRIGIWSDPRHIEALQADLTDVHCFEVTAVQPLCRQLAGTLHSCGEEKAAAFLDRYAFLPAPKTWIEDQCADGHRIAVLFETLPSSWVRVTVFSATHGATVGEIAFAPFRYSALEKRTDSGRCRYVGLNAIADDDVRRRLLLGEIHYDLLLINNPKVVGRQRHEPHKGLAREVRQHRSFGQAFRLLPWHEIKLQITKPADIDDGEPHQDQITGQRALHFVRKFVRIRLGRLEYVSAHWRGNPALGIHQSDYWVGV
jgi:hypothetical protein